MNPNQKSVFLSYASNDAEAAQRICSGLRAAGIDVWFDQSELRGGDAWDQAIRRRVKDCALFIPVVSARTNARSEGYFRLEWRLAVDRSHLMADDQPFIVPVVIDDTTEAGARVPDRFRERQWSRLPGGAVTDAPGMGNSVFGRPRCVLGWPLSGCCGRHARDNRAAANQVGHDSTTRSSECRRVARKTNYHSESLN